MEQAREHFKRCGLSSAVGAKKANNFSPRDLEVYFLDGFHIFILAFEKTADCRAKPTFAFRHLIGLAQIIHLDGFWGHKIAPPVKSDFIIIRTEVLEIRSE
jgi:hypothetical protein